MADANKRDYREALDLLVELFELAASQVDEWLWGGGPEADLVRRPEANPAFRAAKRRRAERFRVQGGGAAIRARRLAGLMRGGWSERQGAD